MGKEENADVVIHAIELFTMNGKKAEKNNNDRKKKKKEEKKDLISQLIVLQICTQKSRNASFNGFF